MKKPIYLLFVSLMAVAIAACDDDSKSDVIDVPAPVDTVATDTVPAIPLSPERQYGIAEFDSLFIGGMWMENHTYDVFADGSMSDDYAEWTGVSHAHFWVKNLEFTYQYVKYGEPGNEEPFIYKMLWDYDSRGNKLTMSFFDGICPLDGGAFTVLKIDDKELQMLGKPKVVKKDSKPVCGLYIFRRLTKEQEENVHNKWGHMYDWKRIRRN